MKLKENNSGITLISLVIMIVVILIISSVAVSSGISSINLSKYKAFVARLEYLQIKINDVHSAYVNDRSLYYDGGDKIGEEILNLGFDIQQSENVDFIFQTIDDLGSGITDKTGFRYYTAKTLENLGISSDGYSYLINIETRQIISTECLEYNGVIYYSLNQVSGSLYNVTYDASTL